MSRTETVNAGRVWEGVKAIAGELAYNQWCIFTVGEVVEKTGIGRATVKKYLDMAWEEGYLTRYARNGRVMSYTIDGTEK
jgi:response regulator of citrate/malate metabolism